MLIAGSKHCEHARMSAGYAADDIEFPIFATY